MVNGLQVTARFSLGVMLVAMAGAGTALRAMQVGPQASVPAPPVSSPTPYAMRGVLLGITLDEFRAIPIPNDSNKTNLASICSSDKRERRSPISGHSAVDARDGIVTCQWFERGPYGAEGELYIALGDGAGSPAFDFIDDGGAKRLFRIRFYANSQYSAAIRHGLADRYGAPKVTTDKVRTGAGIEFDADTLTWSNGTSSIVFDSPCRQIDRCCLTYRHGRLDKLYDAILAKRAAAAAERF